MAWTSVGFDGTITEIQWAGLAGLLGNGYVAAGNGDCLVTAVGGARSVSVAAGSIYGDGVLSTNSGAETVAMTTPVNGQWYVIALRRTWATNTAALVAIAGATTTTTTPTTPPTSFPTLNTNVGVLTDQPIAWAWCNSANTTVVVYDLRMKPYKQTNPVSVASVNDRDAKFPAPVQGTTVWRNDLAAEETYYELYNVSTNPGGRTPAGWSAPKGAVVQVQNVYASSEVTSTSGTATSTGASFSFTPKYATSVIIVQAVINGIRKGDTTTAAQFSIQKDGSEVQRLYSFSGYQVPSGQYFSVSGQYFESAVSTTARTYRTTIQRSLGSSSISCQGDGGVSSLIIWEIA